ncbi:hypothetical protein ANN_08542 [Periplaneta americana]|uniref:Transposase n=1 Tax=Periplaneta americana TaxID=6978 RepID=A0ABQ8T336_PERAM|nr:hypothetical protein ANN_08542 [Periplaneta americana]
MRDVYQKIPLNLLCQGVLYMYRILKENRPSSERRQRGLYIHFPNIMILWYRGGEALTPLDNEFVSFSIDIIVNMNMISNNYRNCAVFLTLREKYSINSSQLHRKTGIDTIKQFIHSQAKKFCNNLQNIPDVVHYSLQIEHRLSEYRSTETSVNRKRSSRQI